MQYHAITLANKVKIYIPVDLYRAYDNMQKRCRLYPQYKGVTICEEWQKSRLNFYLWAIISGWEPGLELDRIGDTDEHRAPYSPATCRWVTHQENCRNRRNCWRALMEFWERMKDRAAPGLTYHLFYQRMAKYKHCFDLEKIERALTKPLRHSRLQKAA